MGILVDAYTSLAGSLIHPIMMTGICVAWIWTASLGLRAGYYRYVAEKDAAGTTLLDAPILAPTGKLHHKVAAGLLFATVFFMSSGMLNTFLRAGRLFPGPHLYGGFFMIITASLQAALVPWLRTVKITRRLHLVFGVLCTIFVLNQVWSGIPVLTSLVSGFLG